MKLDYEAMMASHFQILDKDGGRLPFQLNNIQRNYLGLLYQDYPTMEGVRENNLKARQQGFSSLWNGVFTVDFLAMPNTIGQIVTHKEKETDPFVRRIDLFIDSWCEKEKLKRESVLAIDRPLYKKSVRGSVLFIGTAGVKTLGRGDTLHNIHWSEVGFYPNTSILNAEEIVSPAEEQVKMGIGKIVRESTGNRFGDYFYQEWWRGISEYQDSPSSSFRSRFFPWYEFSEYRMDVEGNLTLSDEETQMMGKYNLSPQQMAWYKEKQKNYKTKGRFLREYPTTPEEAFLASGQGFFDPDVLKQYYDLCKEPIKTGRLAMDGGWL